MGLWLQVRTVVLARWISANDRLVFSNPNSIASMLPSLLQASSLTFVCVLRSNNILEIHNMFREWKCLLFLNAHDEKLLTPSSS